MKETWVGGSKNDKRKIITKHNNKTNTMRNKILTNHPAVLNERESAPR